MVRDGNSNCDAEQFSESRILLCRKVREVHEKDSDIILCLIIHLSFSDNQPPTRPQTCGKIKPASFPVALIEIFNVLIVFSINDLSATFIAEFCKGRDSMPISAFSLILHRSVRELLSGIYCAEDSCLSVSSVVPR